MELEEESKIKQSAEWRRLVELHSDFELSISPTIKQEGNNLELYKLADWRSLFSPTGQSYRSLNRTLMNLPGRIPPSLVTNLTHFILPRPITDRIELTLSLLINNVGELPNNYPIYLHAKRESIIRAMRRVSDYNHTNLSPNRTRDIWEFVRFVYDGDDNTPYHGSIVGLAERAINFHRYSLAEQREKTLQEFGGDQITTRPPIPLPEIEGISFLDTVASVVDEGKQMNHCIASYARQAVCGSSYLFHVERNGESASIEVDRSGCIVQAYGPRNCKNKAVVWGTRILRQWGNDLGMFRHQNPFLDHQIALDDDFPFGR
jgi:hypothetical protein